MFITYFIIFITVIESIRCFYDEKRFMDMAFVPYLISRDNSFWRFASYSLVHANWAHLLVNMYVLYVFGRYVEIGYRSITSSGVGSYLYLLMYLFTVIISTVADYFKHKNDNEYVAVGASGGVSGVLFSAIILYPNMPLMIIFIPIAMPAYLFGILYLVYSAYMSRQNVDNIGHNTHFWGAISGLLFTTLLEPELLLRLLLKIF